MNPTNRNYKLLWILLAVGFCLISGCSMLSPRERAIKQCGEQFLALDKNAFRFPKLRRCLCEKQVDKFEGDAVEACEASCMMAYSALDRKLFRREDFTRCICDGIKAEEDDKTLWPKCSAKFP